MEKMELVECMDDLSFCVIDLQVEYLILNLLENSPDIDHYDESVVAHAKIRTIGFIKQYVDSLACVHNRLVDALSLHSLLENPGSAEA